MDARRTSGHQECQILPVLQRTVSGLDIHDLRQENRCFLQLHTRATVCSTLVVDSCLVLASSRVTGQGLVGSVHLQILRIILDFCLALAFLIYKRQAATCQTKDNYHDITQSLTLSYLRGSGE
jgi:hypothetical protein